jgi:inner membrane protein
MFRNHLIVTTAVAIAAVKYIDFSMPVWAVIGCVFFGSLLPDLDHPGSTIGRRVLFISLPLSGLFGHRQITHSIWPFVGVLWLFNLEMPESCIIVALLIGYSSHLLGDMLSDSGVPLLWPFPIRFGISLCTTGGVLEHITAYSLLAASIVI